MNNSKGTIASLNYLFTVVREDPSMEHVIDRIPDHQFRIVGAVRQTEARGQILRLIEVVIVTVAGILVRRVERCGPFGLWSARRRLVRWQW